MKKSKSINRIFLIGFLFFFNIILAQNETSGEKVGTTTELDNKNIDWEKFDKNSTLSKDKIEIKNIQGLWKAYKGVYKFDEHTNGMELEKPMIIEIKEETYRRSTNSDFEKFKLKNNFIISKKKGKKNIGVINKITSNILTISWKNGNNYTRYYYTK